MNPIQDYFQVMVKILRSARVSGYYTVFTRYAALEFKLRRSGSKITNKLLPRINAALTQTKQLGNLHHPGIYDLISQKKQTKTLQDISLFNIIFTNDL